MEMRGGDWQLNAEGVGTRAEVYSKMLPSSLSIKLISSNLSSNSAKDGSFTCISKTYINFNTPLLLVIINSCLQFEFCLNTICRLGVLNISILSNYIKFHCFNHCYSVTRLLILKKVYQYHHNDGIFTSSIFNYPTSLHAFNLIFTRRPQCNPPQSSSQSCKKNTSKMPLDSSPKISSPSTPSGISSISTMIKFTLSFAANSSRPFKPSWLL